MQSAARGLEGLWLLAARYRRIYIPNGYNHESRDKRILVPQKLKSSTLDQIYEQRHFSLFSWMSDAIYLVITNFKFHIFQENNVHFMSMRPILTKNVGRSTIFASLFLNLFTIGQKEIIKCFSTFVTSSFHTYTCMGLRYKYIFRKDCVPILHVSGARFTYIARCIEIFESSPAGSNAPISISASSIYIRTYTIFVKENLAEPLSRIKRHSSRIT